MNYREIQKLLQSLSNLNNEFSSKDYQLTTLDLNSTQQLVEQLYVELINAKNQTTKSPNIEQVKSQPQPQAVVFVESQTPIEEINSEIEQVFTAPVQSVIEPTPVTTHNSSPFKLGINERLMYAKELFDDDNQALEESIRQLRSFENIETASDFFDRKLKPFLLSEGKDDEIIEEYRTLLLRMY